MSLSSVLTMGYLPDGDASLPLVVLMGYGNGAEPPPVPPPADEAPSFYGPALTPAMRRRWFGDDERRRIFESPLVREARRQAQERLKRIEVGLLPPEPTEDDREEAAEVIAVQVERQIAKAPAPRSREDAKQLAAKVAAAVAQDMKAERERRKAEQIEMQEEEREALALLAGMMLAR